MSEVLPLSVGELTLNQGMENGLLNTVQKWVRIVWTLFTYPLAVPAAVVGAIIGLIWGLGAGMWHNRGALFGGRTGLLRGAIRGVRIIFAGSTWLYRKLFFRKPEMDNLPSFSQPSREFLIIGHRGAPYSKVENTLSSFAKALSEGANALEIDLCVTQDERVVLWHDWDPDSGTAKYRESGLEDAQKYRPYYPKPPARRPVSKLKLDELRSQFGYARKDGSAVPPRRFWRDIPSFDDFIRWAKRQNGLKVVFLDIKIPESEVEQVAPMLAGIHAAIAQRSPSCRFVILSPIKVIVDEIRRIGTDLEICYDREVIHALPVASTQEAIKFSSIRPAETYGHSYASVGRPTTFTLAPFEVYQQIILEDLRYRHDQCLGTRLIAWTINDPQEMATLVEMGVDGILTDFPYRLARQVHNQEAYDIIRNAREWLGLPAKKSP